MSKKEISLRSVQCLEPAGSSNTQKKDQKKDVRDEIQGGKMERCTLCQNSEISAQELEDLLLKENPGSIGEKVTFFKQEFVFAPGEIMKACRLYQQRCPWCQGKGVIPVGIKEKLYE